MEYYSYNSRGIRYIMKFYSYNHFCVKYTTFKKENKIYADVDKNRDYRHLEDIKFEGNSYKEAENKLKDWFKIQTKDIKSILGRGYEIEDCYESVLYSIWDKNIGYHATNIENRESILKNGLIPNGSMDREVYDASIYLDNMNMNPFNIKRAESVYLYPEMENYFLTQKDPTKNQDLYSVIIPDTEKCFMGSIGISGFVFINFEDENPSKYDLKKAKKYGKLYWKNTCSIEEYRNYTPQVREKDRYWGVDEILVGYSIPPKYIKLIGTFDENGEFKETKHFKKYIKKQFKDNYKEIVEYGRLASLA